MNTFHFSPDTLSQAGFAIEPLQELRLFLTTAVANGSLPGVVTFLARGDKVLMHEAIGYADIEGASLLRPDAVFRIHSMTKPFTAIAMLLLYEEGKWGFDDPLSAHIPEFRHFAERPGNRASREPVLRDLFTHSSGHSLGSSMEEIIEAITKFDLFGAASLQDLISRHMQMPLGYEPGSRWEYGVAMDFQAAIVERITGKRYDVFLEERVFAPLGMRDTGFALSHAQTARLVPGYLMNAETRRLQPADALNMQDLIFPIGGSTFRSTAGDYARFARMLLNKGSLGDTRILQPKTAELMFTNMLTDELLKAKHSALHYDIGGGNGFSLNGRLCIDPVMAGRPVGKGTYEWGGAHGPWFWADPEHDIVFVGMTNRVMPHAEIAPLSIVSQDLVYRALRR